MSSRGLHPIVRNCLSRCAAGAGIVSSRLGLALLLGLAPSCTVQDGAPDFGADLSGALGLGQASFVLDGTQVENVLPLSHARRLEALSLRRAETLTNLQ